MSLFIAALGLMGFGFGRLGVQPKRGTGGGGAPVAGTPTYYIYGF